MPAPGTVWASDTWGADAWAADTWDSAISGWTGAAYPSGTAVSDAGVVGTIFLDDATPVPSDAVTRSGIAHHQDGRMYVALWPSSGEVYQEGELAMREDGALLIAPGGAIVTDNAGMGLTYRGEVVVTVSTPDLIYRGKGFLQNGALCVSESS